MLIPSTVKTGAGELCGVVIATHSASLSQKRHGTDGRTLRW